MTKLTTSNSHPYVKIVITDNKGRGIFARKLIKKKTVFLVEPILFVKKKECSNYIYEDQGKTFLGLGYSSLINHSKVPNCFWRSKNFDTDNPIIEFIAYEDICEGEEIQHDYSWSEYPEGFEY